MFTNCYVNVNRCNKEGCWCKPDSAVRWYVPTSLSYRDVFDLMAERDVTVVHSTVCDVTTVENRGQASTVRKAPSP
jgi:hypothetical protein